MMVGIRETKKVHLWDVEMVQLRASKMGS